MFQSKHYKKIFKKYQLNDFDHIWHYMIEWFETPNHRRGGWSGVGKLDLGTQSEVLEKNKDFLSIFVKKQKNHGRRTLLHPFSGEPTFRREFKRLKYLEQKKLGAPKVVFYGEKSTENSNRASLLFRLRHLRDFGSSVPARCAANRSARFTARESLLRMSRRGHEKRSAQSHRSRPHAGH